MVQLRLVGVRIGRMASGQQGEVHDWRKDQWTGRKGMVNGATG